MSNTEPARKGIQINSIRGRELDPYAFLNIQPGRDSATERDLWGHAYDRKVKLYEKYKLKGPMQLDGLDLWITKSRDGLNVLNTPRGTTTLTSRNLWYIGFEYMGVLFESITPQGNRVEVIGDREKVMAVMADLRSGLPVEANVFCNKV